MPLYTPRRSTPTGPRVDASLVRASGPALGDREVIATLPGAVGLAATEDYVYLRHHRTQLFTHRAIGPRYDNH